MNLVQSIQHPILTEKQLTLFVFRDDLNHPHISGNKLRKLKYNLLEAKKQDKKTLLTFGGAFSNHLYAVAAAGKEWGFETIGIVRGEEVSNPTLDFAKNCGMSLHFISRNDYQARQGLDFIANLRCTFGDFYLLPEGGTNELAVKGCMEIPQDIFKQFTTPIDYWCASVGTGGTLAGLILGLEQTRQSGQVLGFSALKGDFLQDEVQKWLPAKQSIRWSILQNYHFGGYAKFNADLLQFIREFRQQTDIPLDPIYTGKMMYGIFDLAKNDFFPKNSRIMAIHTGGLQGIKGFEQRFKLVL